MRSLAAIPLFLIVACGCASTRSLMPTPSLYGSSKTEVFGELAPQLTTTQVELLYVTDRAPETDEEGNRYGYARSYEFTVYHLKQVISWLSDQPEIENIHIIAHSRGTDVAVTSYIAVSNRAFFRADFRVSRT